jgi:hypothetical protein
MPSPIYRLTAQDLRETDRIRRVGGPARPAPGPAAGGAWGQVLRPRRQQPRRGPVLCAYRLPGRRRRAGAVPGRLYCVPGRLGPGAPCAARPRGGLRSAKPAPRLRAAGTGEWSDDRRSRTWPFRLPADPVPLGKEPRAAAGTAGRVASQRSGHVFPADGEGDREEGAEQDAEGCGRSDGEGDERGDETGHGSLPALLSRGGPAVPDAHRFEFDQVGRMIRLSGTIPQVLLQPSS